MNLEYFQMVDKIIDINVQDKHINAEANIPNQSPVFEGHFPTLPLVPGVMLVEIMAQTCGFLILATNKFKQMPFLVGVKQCKLRTFVEPNTKLEINANMEHDGSGFSVMDAKLKTQTKNVSDSRLTFKLTEFPNDKLAEIVRERAEQIGMPTELLARE